MSTNPFSKKITEDDDDDFDVEVGDANSKYRIPEGTYRFRCIDIEKETSKSGNPMWTWTFAVCKGQHEGTELKTWTALTASALWKVVQVGQALGLDIAEGRLKFKKSNVIGKECYGKVLDSEYQGRVNSRIEELYALDSDEGKDASKGSL